MPLDTSIIRQATFQPKAFAQPSRTNELAQAAQAVSALQGLQQNALAMRQAQEEQARSVNLRNVFDDLSKRGETPEVLMQYADAMIKFGSPQLVQAGVMMKQKIMQHMHDLAEERRIEGGGVPVGAASTGMPAPAAAVPAMPPTPVAAAAPQNVPGLVALRSIFGPQGAAPAPNAMAAQAPVANALAQGPGQSEMMAGGAQGTAIASALPASGAGVTLQQYPGAESAFANRMMILPEAKNLPLVQRLFQPSNQPAPEFAFGAPAQPSPAQPAAVVAPSTPVSAAERQPSVQVAGPAVPGALPGDDEAAALRKQISDLEAKRTAYARSNIQDKDRRNTLIKDIDEKIKELRADLRAAKPTTTIQEYEYARTQGFKGTIEDWKKLGSQQISVETKVNALVHASEEAQKEYIKSVAEERKALRNAPDTLANLDAARKLVPNAAAFMGTGGEPLLAAASFLNNRLGFGIKTEGVRDATVLRTRLFESILENLKKLDSSPTYEQQRIMQQALGSLGTDPNALPLVLDKIEEALRSRVDRYNVDVTEAEKRGVKFPFRPQINLPAVETPSGAQRRAPPAPGTIQDGYRFKGGDPGNQANWEKL